MKHLIDRSKPTTAMITHMARKQYGDFVLTDGIRPSTTLEVVPRQGFRESTWREGNYSTPQLIIAASADILFPLFRDLLDLFPEEVNVVLEGSHNMSDGKHTGHWRYDIDKAVLESIALDFEDLLLNDGCAGIAILDRSETLEFQFDEHKLLILYGCKKYNWLYGLLRRYGIRNVPNLRFIAEGEHFHATDEHLAGKFDEMRIALCAEAET